MSDAAVIDVAAVIEGLKPRGFIGKFLILASFMTFFDGFDLSAIAFVAPSMIRQWHLDRAMFSVVFSAGAVGMLVGCIGFGLLSDRFGRKPAALSSIFTFGLFSFLTVFAIDLQQVMVLRFLAGIGIGGLLPIIYTLAIEFVPRRLRATAVTLAMVAFNIGGMLGGIVAASLIPRFGWQVVYWIAGLAPMAIALGLIFLLPESVRFLVSKARPAAEITRSLRQIQPGLAVPDGARFVDLANPAPPAGEAAMSTVRALFHGPLRMITPLLWLSYFFSAVVLYFIISWIPTLAEASAITPSAAALALTAFSFGTMLAGLATMRFLDWHGAAVMPIFPLIACAPLIILGLVTPSDSLFVALLFVAGLGIGGGFNGLNALSAQFYPNHCRGTGASWAVGMARFGGIIGPAAIGLLLALGLPIKGTYLAALVPTVLFILSAAALGWQHSSLLRDERGAALSPAANGMPAGAIELH